ncbi:hypothetical protein GWK47_026763 [Chionoecetes opilio]|uniref:Uncharacterized protein n=1 Tax=Chionoecetes opilio TaxID=41210 RepID=A0A8J8WA09_CHIOP|nr:hypothetical protein GWK47_026763 [Chionoecetes opilio]
MFLHVVDAAEKVYRRLLLRTVDTDVVILAVSTVVQFENTQLWIAYERVLKLPLTQPGDIYSLPKQDPSMPSHQLAQRFCSTQNVPFTRADMFGGRHTYEFQMFLRQSHGDGKRILQEDGSHCGFCCQKQQCPVQSCYGVAVRRDAGDSANVSKLI